MLRSPMVIRLKAAIIPAMITIGVVKFSLTDAGAFPANLDQPFGNESCTAQK